MTSSSAYPKSTLRSLFSQSVLVEDFPSLAAEDKRDEKNAKVFLWDPVEWKRKDKVKILKINLVSRNEIGAAESERSQAQAAAAAFSESFRA